MYRSCLIALMLLSSFARSGAQSAGIAAVLNLAQLPDSLKKGSHAVYQLDEAVLDIASPSRYTYTAHQITTLLDPAAERRLHHTFGVDKFRKLKDVRITVFNALGLPVRQYSRKDFETSAAYDGFSLVTDDKVMRLFTPAPGYPCTVEITYTLEVTSYLELPDWTLTNTGGWTLNSKYQIRVPANLDIRHRSRNITLTPEIRNEGDKKWYTWEKAWIPAATYESDAFESDHYLPQVEVAPVLFEYDGFAGSFRSWEDFGQWNYPFYNDQPSFSPARQQEIRSLTADKTSVREKVEVLYRYLQQNMRYVSIQLGIGGFRPFPAKFVDENKYGDCKALTNFMKHQLAVVGIPSFPALINAQTDGIPADPKFPADPFNHVILCVPDGRDTIWLECTSKDKRAGRLSYQTENRNALLVTENGGILVPTPKSRPEGNRLYTTTQYHLDGEGAARIQTRVHITGEYEDAFRALVTGDDDRQKELLTEYLDMAAADETDLLPAAADSAAGTAFSVVMAREKGFGFKAGTRYFMHPRILKVLDEIPKAELRKQDFLFPYPFEKKDSTVLRYAESFRIGQVPADYHYEDEWIRYRRSYRGAETQRTVTITSLFTLKKQVIPAAVYPLFVRKLQALKEADDQQLILLGE